MASILVLRLVPRLPTPPVTFSTRHTKVPDCFSARQRRRQRLCRCRRTWQHSTDFFLGFPKYGRADFSARLPAAAYHAQVFLAFIALASLGQTNFDPTERSPWGNAGHAANLLNSLRLSMQEVYGVPFPVKFLEATRRKQYLGHMLLSSPADLLTLR